MQYGFVIDQRKCIGCHACTVACKQENDVPVGSFRTWVKYVEKGTYPAVRRHFTVLRCNHCDAAPCVEICPVNALSKRKDAIVDLDRDLCIGCRACMQACPYDALYLNDDSGVAEKCHYCAHRTEIGLEPACVNVCPVEAIVSGDVSDPTSKIARLIAEQPTSRRKLEKGTRPRVWYVDALPEALVPSTQHEPASYIWSDRSPDDAPPPVVPGYEPTPDITATLDVPHRPEWGWHVWTYLVTKNVAAGAMLVAPILALLGIGGFARDYVPEIVALVFLAITNVLLVHDLGRPERSWRIFLRPNTRSWLVKGAWVLTAFGVLTTASLVLRLVHQDFAADVTRCVNIPVAVLASGYSAWLFGQCKGRDLWLEESLFAKLVLRAVLMGTALALVLAMAEGNDSRARILFGVVAVLNVAALQPRSADWGSGSDAQRAFAILKRSLGPTPPFLLAIAAFVVLSFLVGDASSDVFLANPLTCAAVALVIALVVVYERAWIRAGQAVPLS